MAPRHQVATSIVLAVLEILASLFTPLDLEQSEGNRVGFVNWTHVLAEFAGLLAGVAFIHVPGLWTRRM